MRTQCCLLLALAALAVTEPQLRGAAELRPRSRGAAAVSAQRPSRAAAPALLLAKGGSASGSAPAAAPLSHARLGVYLLIWWSLNVLFNICNKQCLNSWPHPWALACLHLAIGRSSVLGADTSRPSLSSS